ncbi:MAG: hypothetical protein ACRCVL_03810, partial [Cetobacterium sp.]
MIDKINTLSEVYRRKKPVRPVITVKQINVHLVWSRHNQNLRERSSAHRARQGCVMGKVITTSQPTPAEVVIAKHKTDEKYIKKCMMKWHDRTHGVLQWPKEGTFRLKRCEEVKEMLRHWKVGKEDDKTRGKRIKRLEIL